MGTPERKPRPSAEDEVRALLAEGRITEARRYLETAGDLIPAGSTLREIFAPPRVARIDARDSDRTREYRWLKENAKHFRGRWVAVLGDQLVSSAGSLKELLATLSGIETPVEPLIHRIP